MSSSKKRNNDIEFSLVDLLSNVCGKAIMIISLAIAFASISILLGFISSHKYNISLSIQLPTVNTSVYTPYDFNYFYSLFVSKEMIETTYQEVTGEHELAKDINKHISISYSGNTMHLSAPKTSEPDKYTEFLSLLIDKALDIYKENNRIYIDKEIKLLEEEVEYLNSQNNLDAIETAELIKTISESNLTIHRMNEFKDKLDDDIIYVNHLSIDDIPSSFHSLKMIVIFGILGGFIGVCIAIVMALLDKHNYKSVTLLNCLNDENDFIGAIPAYKKDKKINDNYFRYLLKQIPEDYSKVYLSSISDKAGVNTITEGFKAAAKEANSPIQIENRPSIMSNPLDSLKIDATSMMILVIKAGEDTYDNISIISNDLMKRNVRTAYILNFADPTDRNVIRFESNDNTLKLGLFRNPVSFYKKLYK